MARPTALDTFTGADGTIIGGHPPDYGFTGWSDRNGPGTVPFLDGNKLRIRWGSYGLEEYTLAASSFTQGDDYFDYYADIVPVSSSARPELRFRCTSAIDREHSGVILIPTNSGGSTTFMYRRRKANIVEQTWTSPVVNLSGILTTGIRLGLSVESSTVSVWTEPHGGGTRTQRWVSLDTTPKLDGSHRFFGIGWVGSVDTGTTFDNVAVTPHQRIAVNLSSSSFTCDYGSPVSFATTVTVTNIGPAASVLQDLGVVVQDGPGGSGWLTASLDTTVAPATITIIATSGNLAPSHYTSTVSLNAWADNYYSLTSTSFDVNLVIVPSTRTVRFAEALGGASPSSSTVGISGNSDTSLSDLTLGGMTGYGSYLTWLDYSLDTTQAPAVLTLRPYPGLVPTGTSTVTIPVQSSLATNSPIVMTTVYVSTYEPSRSSDASWSGATGVSKTWTNLVATAWGTSVSEASSSSWYNR